MIFCFLNLKDSHCFMKSDNNPWSLLSLDIYIEMNSLFTLKFLRETLHPKNLFAELSTT